MADRLTLAHALEEGGIPRDAAEHIATEILDAIHQNVASKSDLAATRAELSADIASVRTELASLRAELKADIASVRAELKADIASVRAELVSVRADLSLIEHRVLTRVGGMIVAATGILVAIHYIH
jgi:septal ring factor EnvC (AmiA/AmiB activator)